MAEAELLCGAVLYNALSANGMRAENQVRRCETINTTAFLFYSSHMRYSNAVLYYWILIR